MEPSKIQYPLHKFECIYYKFVIENRPLQLSAKDFAAVFFVTNSLFRAKIDLGSFLSILGQLVDIVLVTYGTVVE